MLYTVEFKMETVYRLVGKLQKNEGSFDKFYCSSYPQAFVLA